MIKEGQVAPEVSLPDADMEMLTVSDYRGRKNVVLYFYPKDNTPGCTRQALDFSDLEDEFAAADTVVLGISKDDCVSHANFRDKHGLTVQLLADTDGEACEAYGVWREKEKDGVKRMGILRSTFVIDKKGVVRHALYDVKPDGHAAQILALVKEMK